VLSQQRKRLVEPHTFSPGVFVELQVTITTAAGRVPGMRIAKLLVDTPVRALITHVGDRGAERGRATNAGGLQLIPDAVAYAGAKRWRV
jgi:hypothetical protein